jgi:hypothetical protein
MAVALCGCGKSEAVKNAEQEISSLGDTLTLDDADAVSKARATYNQLEEKEKGDVANYQKLLDAEATIETLKEQAKEQEWRELLDNEIAFLKEIEGDCDVVIDLYSRISSAASNAPSYFGRMGETDVNEYYGTIRYFDGTKTIEHFKARYGTSSSSLGAPYWQKKLFWAAVIVYPEKYSFVNYAHLPKDDAYIATKAEVDDAEQIVSNCEAYNTIIDNLAIKNALAFETIKTLKDMGGPEKQAIIDALYNYYLTVDSAVNYVLSPSGSLSSVVSQYSNVKTAIEQARKTLDIVA